VVSFDAVVEVFRLTVLDGHRIIPLQLSQRFAIGPVLVGVDDVRRPVLVCSQGLPPGSTTAYALDEGSVGKKPLTPVAGRSLSRASDNAYL
jgi:hypothetical protein